MTETLISFGRDEYGRYIEVRGERYAVERYPYWGWRPSYVFSHAWAWFNLVLWYLSNKTGLAWSE